MSAVSSKPVRGLTPDTPRTAGAPGSLRRQNPLTTRELDETATAGA